MTGPWGFITYARAYRASHPAPRGLRAVGRAPSGRRRASSAIRAFASEGGGFFGRPARPWTYTRPSLAIPPAAAERAVAARSTLRQPLRPDLSSHVGRRTAWACPSALALPPFPIYADCRTLAALLAALGRHDFCTIVDPREGACPYPTASLSVPWGECARHGEVVGRVVC